MANTPVDLTAMVERERAKLVADKQQQTEQLPESPLSTPIRNYLSQNQDLLAWERAQDKLSTLSHIFKWISEDPGMARRLQILADRCKRHATQAEHGEFLLAKEAYLGILGELAELFYLQHPSWEVKELVNLNMSKLRAFLAVSAAAFQKHVTNLPSDTVCILVREVPAWVVASPGQREDMLRTKAIFPDSVVVSA